MKEPLTIFNTPIGGQVHIHKDAGAGSLQYPTFRYELDARQAAMADLLARNLEFPRTDAFVNTKRER